MSEQEVMFYSSILTDVLSRYIHQSIKPVTWPLAGKSGNILKNTIRDRIKTDQIGSNHFNLWYNNLIHPKFTKRDIIINKLIFSEINFFFHQNLINQLYGIIGVKKSYARMHLRTCLSVQWKIGHNWLFMKIRLKWTL